MKMIIEVTDDTKKFITEYSSNVSVNGNDYFFLPFWIKTTKGSSEIETYSLGYLPEELVDAIKEKWEEIPKKFIPKHLKTYPVIGE